MEVVKMNLTNSNYIEEIINIIQSETNSQKLSEQLSNYHDNDIANSLELLSQIERKKLYKTLGIEKTSEIFAYLEDATSYLEEIELEKAAMIVEEMDSDDAVDILENIDEDMLDKADDMLGRGDFKSTQQKDVAKHDLLAALSLLKKYGK
jgi:magnesium transporter